MSVEIKYKIDKKEIYKIQINRELSIEDILKKVSEKHNIEFKSVFSTQFECPIDPEDSFNYWFPEDEEMKEDSLFYFSTKEEITEDDKSDFEEITKPESESSSSSEDEEGKPDKKAENPKKTDDEEYPEIPSIGAAAPIDSLLQTQINTAISTRYKIINNAADDGDPDEFYIYSTTDYHSMITPTKVTIPYDSTYADTEKAIRKALKVKNELQIHIYLPTGLLFTPKYGKKNEKNRLSNFFNNVDAQHILYAIITRHIDDDVLDSQAKEICNVSNKTMRLLVSPICDSNVIGYSRFGTLLGSFYYRGLKTYNFIKSVARCTKFAPLVSGLSSILYHEEITGQMLVTVTASLFTLFSHLLPSSVESKYILSKCLECACYILHVEETYQSDNKKSKGAGEYEVNPIEIEKAKKDDFVKYLIAANFKGTFYECTADVSNAQFDVTELQVPDIKFIQDLFNNYASFRPLPPLSARLNSFTCIVQYIKGQTILFIPSVGDDESEDTINIIDPFKEGIQVANIEQLAKDVEKYSEDAGFLIDAKEVEELIVILFDISGSMLNQYDSKRGAVSRKYDRSGGGKVAVCGDTSRFAIASQYLTTFLNRSFGFRLPHLISLISFNDECEVKCDFSPLSQVVENGAAALSIRGKSRVWDALDTAINKLKEFNKDKKYPNAKPRILIFSDGIDAGSKKKPEKVCQKAINSNIIVDSVVLTLTDNCENLCKLSHLTGGYSLRSEDTQSVNAIFEKESFLSLNKRPEPDIEKSPITEDVFNDANEAFDSEVSNYDYIKKTHNVNLSTPNCVMAKAKKEKKEPERRTLRLLREIKNFQKQGDDKIKLYIDTNDINNWRVYILGPDGTPYEDFWWYLSITFNETYPLSPPLFRFITVPYHINISEDGRVCANFLYKSYKSIFTVYELVTKVKDLLSDPDTNAPIQSTKRMLYFDDNDAYEENAVASTDDAVKSYKDFLKGCKVSDDTKFVVKDTDFENAEQEMEEKITDFTLPLDVGISHYVGPSIFKKDGDDDDDDELISID